MSTFIQATVTVNGRTFRAWVRASESGFSIVYDERQAQLAQLGLARLWRWAHEQR